jgi:hypothetical protein
MRRILAIGIGFGCAASAALTFGCNSVLNNESGQLADAGAAMSASEDSSVGALPPVDATAPPPSEDAGPVVVVIEDAGTIPTCAFGQKLCNGACVSVNDPLFGCGTTACAPCSLEHATATCAGSGCAVGTCDPGYADCSSAAAGCETSLSDPDHCGACNVTCGTTAPYCAPTSTSGQFGCTDECPPTASTLCSDECVDLSSSVDDCGACGSPCPVTSNGEATCSSGQCGFLCDADFHACGAACVSDVAPATCGASCSPCPAEANAVATCNGTACGMACDPGFANCNGAAADGCEANLETDSTNCGQCGVSCHGAACVSGACAPPPDAGSPPMDAGSPPVDAGQPPPAVDAGSDSGSASGADGGI